MNIQKRIYAKVLILVTFVGAISRHSATSQIFDHYVNLRQIILLLLLKKLKISVLCVIKVLVFNFKADLVLINFKYILLHKELQNKKIFT